MTILEDQSEAQRVAALRSYSILDTLPEQAYDDVVRLASEICQTPMALITFVDSDRQWFKAKRGVDISETPRNVSFCSHAIATPLEIMVVPDATRDERFAENPFVTGEPNIRFYAGAPLNTPDGFSLGTLCVIDDKPRELTAQQEEALGALARQTIRLLEALRQKHELQELLDELHRLQLDLKGQNIVYQNCLEGISRIGADGRYEMANIRYAAACGYEPDEMIGMPWQMTILPSEVARMEGFYQQMLKAGRAETETIGVRKDGRMFYKHIIMVPYYAADNSLRGHYCFMRDITEHKIKERRLVRRAYHDVLTDLPNRASFEERLGELMGRAERRSDYGFAILYMDLNDFKPVNDTLGHAAGDFVLKETARHIAAAIRPEDLPARVGGDEFCILLDDVDDCADAQEVADRIHEAMDRPFFWEDKSFPISASIGLTLSRPGATVKELMDECDQDMYSRKIRMKNEA